MGRYRHDTPPSTSLSSHHFSLHPRLLHLKTPNPLYKKERNTNRIHKAIAGRVSHSACLTYPLLGATNATRQVDDEWVSPRRLLMAISALATSTLSKGAFDLCSWKQISSELTDRNEFPTQPCQCFPELQQCRRKLHLDLRGSIAPSSPGFIDGR